MADPSHAGPSDDLNFVLVLYELATSDVSEPESEGGFEQALRSFPGRQLTSTAWLLKTPRSATTVLESLSQHLTPAERLVVAELKRVGWCNIENGENLFGDLIHRSSGGGAPDQS